VHHQSDMETKVPLEVNEYGRYGGVPVRLPLRTMSLHIMGGLETFVRAGAVHIERTMPQRRKRTLHRISISVKADTGRQRDNHGSIW
jgi:hypothetical protein